MVKKQKYTCCSVEGCVGRGEVHKGIEYFVQGLCQSHYKKLRKYGDPLHEEPRLKHHHCKVEGCNNSGVVDPRRGKAYFPNGFCNMHYKRWAAHGDPLTTHKHRSRRVYMDHPLLKCWMGIRARCMNPRDKLYKYYGGRGITICDRWQGTEGFVNFITDMGPKPSNGHSVERTDNSKGYHPENCYWATRHEQSANRRSSSKHLGVTWNESRKKWVARIMVARKRYPLGEFNNLEDAIAARKTAELKLNITYSHDTRNTTPKI